MAEGTLASQRIVGDRIARWNCHEDTPPYLKGTASEAQRLPFGNARHFQDHGQ
jgi:hypothetical protein